MITKKLSEHSPGWRSVLSTIDSLVRRPVNTIASYLPPVPQAHPGSRPLVSVIVPCFNYGRFLPSSVGSAVDQRDCETEVIIVDDASTDPSLEVAHKLAQMFSNVRVLANDHNCGHVVTFNNGLAEATGDYVVRLDADDLLTPGSLNRALDLFGAYPSVGLVYGRPRHFTSEAPPVPVDGNAKWTVWRGHDWIRERCKRAVNCITTPEAVVRSSVFKEIGPLSPKLRFAQDMEIWLRTAAVSDVGYIAGPDQALHRDHPASMSVTIGAGLLTDLFERRTVFEVLFEGLGQNMADWSDQQKVAMRQLSREAVAHVCRSYDRGHFSWTESEDFIDFARETYPSVVNEREWRAMEWRRRLGPKLAARNPISFARAVTRRIEDELAFARWLETGI